LKIEENKDEVIENQPDPGEPTAAPEDDHLQYTSQSLAERMRALTPEETILYNMSRNEVSRLISAI
jgi:hypothetical protein